MIAEIRRNTARYREEDLRAVPSNELLDPKVFHSRLRAALNQAESFVVRMPTDKAGLLFLKGGQVVQPDPDSLDAYTTHEGQRRGHWPSNSEIIAALFEYHGKKPQSS